MTTINMTTINWKREPQKWTRLRVSIEQNVEQPQNNEYTCQLSSQDTIHARHFLTVTSHAFRARPTINVQYAVNAGAVGIAQRTATPPICQPDQRTDSWKKTLPPATTKKAFRLYSAGGLMLMSATAT